MMVRYVGVIIDVVYYSYKNVVGMINYSRSVTAGVLLTHKNTTPLFSFFSVGLNGYVFFPKKEKNK